MAALAACALPWRRTVSVRLWWLGGSIAPHARETNRCSRCCWALCRTRGIQNVVLQVADWSPIAKGVEITVFNAPLGEQDKVIGALQDFEIVVGMRERTPFPRALLEKLPRLRLLVSTGMRNASIDLAAARERGVVVCGTPRCGNPARPES